MKSFHSYVLCILTALLLVSCNDNIDSVGSSIQPTHDKIVVKANVYNLETENLFLDRIYNRPDVFLLGTYDDKKYGKLQADILAQFNHPFGENMSAADRFPENAKADSAILVLYYGSWHGSRNSLLNATVYRMNTDKKLDPDAYYPSNIDPSEYVNFSASRVVLGKKAFTARDITGTADSTMIVIDLSEDKDFVQELFDISKEYGLGSTPPAEDFLNRFKGVYINTDLGDATMMHISAMRMLLYYSYEVHIEGKDTVLSNYQIYSANSEVTQINRFLHPNRDEIVNQLNSNPNVNYISSPANIYSRVNIPLRGIAEDMLDSIGTEKRLFVNNATIKVEPLFEDEKDSLDLSQPGYVLLMKEEDMDQFFTKERLPNDSVLLSAFSSTDSTYTFNIATLLTNELKKATVDRVIHPEQMNEELKMVMVPVSVSTSSDYYGNTTVNRVRQQPLMTGVEFRSGQNDERPMKVRVTFSGF